MAILTVAAGAAVVVWHDIVPIRPTIASFFKYWGATASGGGSKFVPEGADLLIELLDIVSEDFGG